MAKKKHLWPYFLHFTMALELWFLGIIDFIVTREAIFAFFVILFVMKDFVDLLRIEAGMRPLLNPWFEHFPYALCGAIRALQISSLGWWTLILGLDALYDFIQDWYPGFFRK